MNNEFSFGKTVQLEFDKAVEAVTDALEDQGFGVLTEIDVQATLRKKLDKETRPYRILGACNPELAHRALSAEPQIGVLLPCNVVVREGEDGQVHVEFMDPQAVLNLVDNPAVHDVAAEVRDRLTQVFEAI
ncbi:DUF302 domain-containing protein [Wenzhouxiangella sp. XN201]|uniref:DUF302 domain-containing protein n=1 Tax=Wenzhouxiangella sp. XN201 TaxID=2710755 RepID=UPI0013C55026|nr:DUF302 domain-containing protein [Wenzhouxiangella sp. XN201]NEZ03803.1 DUF302 domain-containing protein [Wenzhouxiangella sp. XN201]